MAKVSVRALLCENCLGAIRCARAAAVCDGGWCARQANIRNYINGIVLMAWLKCATCNSNGKHDCTTNCIFVSGSELTGTFAFP